MEPDTLKGFDYAEYKAALVKVLDMAREGHSFLVGESLRLQVEVAKAYMWVSSIIGTIAMFIVKDVTLTHLAKAALTISLVLAAISFALSLLVLYGRNQGRHALIAPKNLSMFVYDRFSESKFPDTETITGLIAAIDDSNVENIAANNMRKNKLRVAAPFLYASFVFLCLSIVMR